MKTSTMLLLGGGAAVGILLMTRKAGAGAGATPPASGPTDIFAGAKPWTGTTGQGNAVAPGSSGSQTPEKSAPEKAQDLIKSGEAKYQQGTAAYNDLKACADGDMNACARLYGDADNLLKF